jgi:hypothetical protein
MYPFGLYLFTFFNAHDSQVWSFEGVTEFLPILFIALELFDSDFFCFSLISILSSRSQILSSTCSSLLEWPSTVFLVWLKFLFIYRISVWFFFLRFSISLLNSSFVIFVVIFNSYISLFIASLFHFHVCWSTFWVPLFVSVSSYVLYFCVLKFLQCILYILVCHV